MSIVKQLLPSQARAKIAQIRAGDFEGWFGVRGTRDHSLRTEEWRNLVKLANTKPEPTPEVLRARKDIEYFKGNAEFQKSMRAHDPKDRELAQSEWTRLHQAAYPSTAPVVDRDAVKRVQFELAADPLLAKAYGDTGHVGHSLAKAYVADKLKAAVTVPEGHDDIDDGGVTCSFKTTAAA